MSNRWLTKPRMFLKGKSSAYIIKLSHLHIANMLAGIKSNEQSIVAGRERYGIRKKDRDKSLSC